MGCLHAKHYRILSHKVSIGFAALAGWLWLDERFGSIRAIGASVIFVGIIVIAVAG